MRTPRRTPAAGAEAPSRPLRGRRAHARPPADERAGLQEDVAQAAKAIPTRAGRWRTRPRTVRARILCLLMAPVVSLLVLWAYATVTTAQDIAGFRQSQRVDTTVRAPVAAATAALQAERLAAVRHSTAPEEDQGQTLQRLAERTDRAVTRLRLGDRHTVAAGIDLPTAAAERLDSFVTGAERLRTLRAAVLDRRAGWRETYDQYTATISEAFGVDGALTGVQGADPGSHARVLLEFARAREALEQEDALLVGARLVGGLDGERLRLFTIAVDTRRALTESAAADLRGPEQAAWADLAGGSGYAAIRSVEDRVLASEPGTAAIDPAPENVWNPAHARVRDGMRAIEAGAGRSVADRADPLTHGLLTPAGAVAVLGLVAVVAALVVSGRIGRGLVVELTALRDNALDIARRQLPQSLMKLRAGEEIDIDAEAPTGPPAEDEAEQVATALGTVHRAALHAAAERAELASGITEVIVNLARRSQVLVHRQLALLDTMKRRFEDPEELSDLFRLDHLTTRMRRHAESLIVLSGAAPGRAWRLPVPLTDVVRAAVSELEHCTRVEVRHIAEARITGAAVADLTHLLAELVENAAQFSPPHTRVRITGEPVGNGYALEIEDRGLGMSKESLAEANHRIEQAEDLDLFDSDRLGLFVVSRLASRRGIKVHLRTSPYGGTTAVVLLPTALLLDGTAGPPPDTAVDTSRSAAGTLARVSVETRHVSGRQPVERPALTTPVTSAVELTAPMASAAEKGPAAHATSPGPPRSATPLRLRRAPVDSGGSDDLPQRVRQASLAPQLRERRTGRPPGPADTRSARDERTPDLVRQRMAAYDDGWARGGGASGRGTDAAAHSDEGDRT
ncbi:sensor histidine kinase [Streptomyces poonensis]|uniref:histidine kinase n=1 Tax=Streptomyces poonensis TaxID=68255 RepID=A0A918UUW4_9ACTN|nr:ATP-binding protein [Streptomyces poonensis]GGZ34916.1 ATPase [Streptomyces poonensis]GLJ89527.1 ATPase [Streptomyces poonensis]